MYSHGPEGQEVNKPLNLIQFWKSVQVIEQKHESNYKFELNPFQKELEN